MNRFAVCVMCLAVINGCSKSVPEDWGSVHWLDSSDRVKIAYPDAHAITPRSAIGRLRDCSTDHAWPGYERISSIGEQKFSTTFCFDDSGLRSVEMKMIDGVSLAPSADDPLLKSLISSYGKPSKADDGIPKIANFGWFRTRTTIILNVIRIIPGDTQVGLTFLDASAKLKPPS